MLKESLLLTLKTVVGQTKSSETKTEEVESIVEAPIKCWGVVKKLMIFFFLSKRLSIGSIFVQRYGVHAIITYHLTNVVDIYFPNWLFCVKEMAQMVHNDLLTSESESEIF